MISLISVFRMHNITHTWCEDRNFASQKFRLTPGGVVYDDTHQWLLGSCAVLSLLGILFLD